jgi:hypothetical protein
VKFCGVRQPWVRGSSKRPLKLRHTWLFVSKYLCGASEGGREVSHGWPLCTSRPTHVPVHFGFQAPPYVSEHITPLFRIHGPQCQRL